MGPAPSLATERRGHRARRAILQHHDSLSVLRISSARISHQSTKQLQFLPRLCFVIRLKTHAHPNTKRSGRAHFADEARRREPGIRKRERDVARVERVANPQLAEHVRGAHAGAQVGERVRALPRRVGIVVLKVAVADGLGPRGQREPVAQRAGVLNAEVGGVARRVRQLVAAHVDAVGPAAVREARVREAGAAEQIEIAIRRARGSRIPRPSSSRRRRCR